MITAHGPFQGLDRFEARPAILAALREQGRVAAERPYLHAVGHCWRCGTTVEPRLSLQWFVKVGPLAKAAGDAVRDGRVRIHPQQMAARYFDWVDDMHDWCISRQLWWGHRIPVYTAPNPGGCGGPAESLPQPEGRMDAGPRRPGHLVFLPPVAVLHPRLARRHRGPATFYPTSVLVTSYDILFFWVARMMMFGLYATSGDDPPRRCRSAWSRCTAWSAIGRQEDVEVPRQHRRTR